VSVSPRVFDQLDAHLTRARDEHRELIRDEAYIVESHGRVRCIEMAWCEVDRGVWY